MRLLTALCFAAFLLTLALVAPSCSSAPSRHVATDGSPAISISTDLKQASADFLDFVSGSELTPHTCAPVLSQVYAKLFHLPSIYFNTRAVDRAAGEIIQNVFQSRIYLRYRLGEFERAGRLTPGCVDAARDVIRAARFLEDYVGERLLKPAPADPKKLQPAWSGEGISILVNPDRPEAKEPFELRKNLRSGDILLSRGAAFSSAAIARIGNVDSQFSHLALVYIEPGTGKVFVVEAHIEVGVLVSPLEKYLADGKVRSALYRYPDAELAARAARLMFEKASAATAAGHNIPYNFGLDLTNTSEFFCSQVVSHGFELASDGKVHLPLFQSRLDQTNPEFLDLIGVKARQTFLPGDVEVDPRLEFIAEWRDFSRMKDTRMKDAVLTKMYEWMSTRDYRLHGNFKAWVAENVMYRLRRWPVFEHFLKEKFPLNMNRSALGALVVMGTVVDTLLKRLELEEANHQKTTGLSMSAQDMQEVLENYRAEDAQRMPGCKAQLTRPKPWARNKSDFHKLFRPNC